jgi:hypothetical protein
MWLFRMSSRGSIDDSHCRQINWRQSFFSVAKSLAIAGDSGFDKVENTMKSTTYRSDTVANRLATVWRAAIARSPHPYRVATVGGRVAQEAAGAA